ncbi:MAG: DUF3226 domain-containing protein [Bacteroidia bacterium]
MAHTLLIVESPNDEAFFRLLIQTGQQPEITPIQDTEIEHLHNFVGTDGKEKRGKDALPEKLAVIKTQLSKSRPDIQHIAVILDADSPPSGGKQQSLALINQAFEKAFGVNTGFTELGQEVEKEVDLSGEMTLLKLSCYLTHDSSGEGNLDTVMKAIASKSCPESDCPEEMNKCVVGKTGKPMRDFTKQWVNYYVRSHASKKQLQNAEKRLHEVITDQGTNIFDLNSPLIAGIKSYLNQISGFPA